MHLFQFRFHWWFTFIPLFAKKSLWTVSVAILNEAIITKMAILANLAIIAWPNMARDMVNSDFFANIRINVDQQWKRNWKRCIGLKVMAKTKLILQLWPFPMYFWLFWGEKWPLNGKHFPWVPRAHPYIFGISRTRRMGKQTELIVKMIFDFFEPPYWTGLNSLI